MATLDFSPLFRRAIGFERVPGMLAHALERAETSYPPYNIEKCGANEYRIVLAVAGFSREDIDVVTEQNLLTIRGRQRAKRDGDFLYHGIAARSFERVFDLADYVEVTGAYMGDGMLIIDLKRELPEALKPRQIPIASAPMKHIEARPRQAAA
jgi:molecular chaperone IbpA